MDCGLKTQEPRRVMAQRLGQMEWVHALASLYGQLLWKKDVLWVKCVSEKHLKGKDWWSSSSRGDVCWYWSKLYHTKKVIKWGSKDNVSWQLKKHQRLGILIGIHLRLGFIASRRIFPFCSLGIPLVAALSCSKDTPPTTLFCFSPMFVLQTLKTPSGSHVVVKPELGYSPTSEHVGYCSSL